MLSLLLWANFDTGTAAFQFVENFNWLGGGINYKMGVDGISVLFVVLTALLMPICILASEAIHARVREYMIAFLVLETLMIGVFCALDLVVFYVFFEGGLIPMFLIIGVWGGPRRVYATFKFFPLHAVGLGADAARHHGDLLADRHHRYRGAARRHPSHSRRHAALAVVRVPRLLRGEAAHVAGAHLASRRACGGADRGFGDPRRHPPEDGRIRIPALSRSRCFRSRASNSRR